MDVNKIFAELGRMHLELMQVKEQLAEAQAEIAKYRVVESHAPVEASKP